MTLSQKINELFKSSIIKTVGIYTITNFLTKGMSFLLVPLFTNPKYLTPEDNGMLSLFSNASLFLMPIISLGIVQSTSSDYFKLSKEEFRDFFTTSFFLAIVMTLFSVGMIYVYNGWLETKFDFKESFVWIIPLITFLTFCNEQITRIIRNTNDSKKYFWIGISKTGIELGLSVLLIVSFGWGWNGRVIGMLIALLFITIYSYRYFTKGGYLFGKIRKHFIVKEFQYALPIIFMQASIFSLSSSDKFFLSGNKELVGIYGTACIFSSVIVVFSGAMSQYFTPAIFNLLSEEKINYNKIKRNIYSYILAMLILSVGVILGTSFFYKWFINEKYHAALRYIYYIGIGYFFWSIISILYTFLLYYKRKMRIFLLAAFSILVSLTLNWILIPRYNDWGAAVATAISHLAVLVVCLFFTREYWLLFFTKKGNDFE